MWSHDGEESLTEHDYRTKIVQSQAENYF
jgi:hypothetical protein